IRERFPPASDVDRAAVLRYVAGAPLRYGEWKHLKALYKQAETAGEAEILGTLIGRLDAEPLSTSTVAPLTWPELQYPHQTRAAATWPWRGVTPTWWGKAGARGGLASGGPAG